MMRIWKTVAVVTLTTGALAAWMVMAQDAAIDDLVIEDVPIIEDAAGDAADAAAEILELGWSRIGSANSLRIRSRMLVFSDWANPELRDVAYSVGFPPALRMACSRRVLRTVAHSVGADAQELEQLSRAPHRRGTQESICADDEPNDAHGGNRWSTCRLIVRTGRS